MDSSWKKNYVRYKTVLLNNLDQYQKKADLRIYVEIILSLITISIFSIFALRPTLITIAKLVKDVESKKEVLEQMGTKLSQLQQAQMEYDREEEKITMLRTAIPTTPSPDIFIRQVEGISNRSASVTNMSIGEVVVLGTSIPPQKTPDQASSLPEGVVSTNASINAQTQINNYSSAYEFLRGIENLRAPLFLDTFSFSIDESKEGEKFLVIFISGRLVALKNYKQ